jgi:hypothetical protein
MGVDFISNKLDFGHLSGLRGDAEVAEQVGG